MSVLYPPDTPYAKEMVKWEAQGSTMGPGLRPYQFRPLPAWMFKAGRPANGLGKDVITDERLVESESEESAAWHLGFRATPTEALDLLEAERLEIAKLAASLEYEKKNTLSPRAVAEVEAAQAVHPGHLPTVPVTPIKPRRGRPAKGQG